MGYEYSVEKNNLSYESRRDEIIIGIRMPNHNPNPEGVEFLRELWGMGKS